MMFDRLLWSSLFLCCLVLNGCRQSRVLEQKPQAPLLYGSEFGTQVSSVAELLATEPIQVQGYGIVGGLGGTGSSHCPPGIRKSLKTYILKRLPKDSDFDIDAFINSTDTAVVRVYGRIPPVASKNEQFDIRVEALSGTDTTSLSAGQLYTMDMRVIRRYDEMPVQSRIVAQAAGPVFIDKCASQSDLTKGFVLGGGRVLEDRPIAVSLFEPDYQMSSVIRNRLLMRFGEGVAQSKGPGLIYLTPPESYRNAKQRFARLVSMAYLGSDEQMMANRITRFASDLQSSDNKNLSEAALEAIGKPALPALQELLSSQNEEVRLRAARCMLNIGSNAGLNVLSDIAMRGSINHRVAAIDAIGSAASRNNAIAILGKFLGEESFDVSFAAYQQLRRLDDISIISERIGDNFDLDIVTAHGPKIIYVSRSSAPKIVLFGAPIYCEKNIFIRSSDETITINATDQTDYVSIIRTRPERSGPLTPPLRSSFALANIIRRLSEAPSVPAGRKRLPGLAVPYSETTKILQDMVEKGAVHAQFRMGPGVNIK
ncbi:MAG: flagellar basal body P-ring protein FlgI [Planctomycetota bacterium]